MNKIKNNDKKKIKNKLEESKKKNEELKIKLNLIKDKFFRTLAEFDNYKKRNDKEQKNILKLNIGNIIKNILPILDDFKRLIKEEKITNKDGIYFIYKKLKKILEDNGLKKIKVNIGDDFNPDFHYAITQVKNKKMKNKIVQILEDGYYVYDNIIRCVKVIVGS
ncbi:MAG: nucleotide exchange factor GrpE [Candidatus Shikimatogenerans bostrichidophilus]|nr:MAG: nucleotide exchange factor GrpE [Candidatus Shikimatogenerans bostrichidophilus]